MSFFQPLPEPRRECRPPTQPWAGPPANELGAAAPVSILLARTERFAVGIESATAFSSGVELKLVVRRRRVDDGEDLDEFAPFGWGRRGAARDQLRFGVQFSDGTKAVLDGPGGAGAEEPRVALRQRGGHGSDDEHRLDLWLWPLPPGGPIAFVVAWPAAGIAETRVEIDASAIRDAAARAVPLWPEQATPPPGGYHTSREYLFGGEAEEPEPPA